MLETNRIGIFAAILAATFALTGMGTPDAAAQFNEKRVERQATGKYTGKITGGKVQEKDENGKVTHTFPAGLGQGKVKVPVKDGKLKTTARDPEIAGPVDKAKFVGKEKKSDVRRNGKKIIVKAGGSMEIVQGHSKKTKGTVAGDITARGNKHIADVRFKGEKNDTFGPGSTCYNVKTKGRK